MHIRLYIDEDAMSRILESGLRARGIDITSAFQDKNIGLSDIEQLEYATAHQRVLCTCNISDFYRIHSDFILTSKQHSGIIFIPQQRYHPSEQVRRLLILIASLSAEDMINRIEFLSEW